MKYKLVRYKLYISTNRAIILIFILLLSFLWAYNKAIAVGPNRKGRDSVVQDTRGGVKSSKKLVRKIVYAVDFKESEDWMVGGNNSERAVISNIEIKNRKVKGNSKEQFYGNLVLEDLNVKSNVELPSCILTSKKGYMGMEQVIFDKSKVALTGNMLSNNLVIDKRSFVELLQTKKPIFKNVIIRNGSKLLVRDHVVLPSVSASTDNIQSLHNNVVIAKAAKLAVENITLNNANLIFQSNNNFNKKFKPHKKLLSKVFEVNDVVLAKLYAASDIACIGGKCIVAVPAFIESNRNFKAENMEFDINTGKNIVIQGKQINCSGVNCIMNPESSIKITGSGTFDGTVQVCPKIIEEHNGFVEFDLSEFSGKGSITVKTIGNKNKVKYPKLKVKVAPGNHEMKVISDTNSAFVYKKEGKDNIIFSQYPVEQDIQKSSKALKNNNPRWKIGVDDTMEGFFRGVSIIREKEQADKMKEGQVLACSSSNKPSSSSEYLVSNVSGKDKEKRSKEYQSTIERIGKLPHIKDLSFLGKSCAELVKMYADFKDSSDTESIAGSESTDSSSDWKWFYNDGEVNNTAAFLENSLVEDMWSDRLDSKSGSDTESVNSGESLEWDYNNLSLMEDPTAGGFSGEFHFGNRFFRTSSNVSCGEASCKSWDYCSDQGSNVDLSDLNSDDNGDNFGISDGSTGLGLNLSSSGYGSGSDAGFSPVKSRSLFQDGNGPVIEDSEDDGFLGDRKMFSLNDQSLQPINEGEFIKSEPKKRRKRNVIEGSTMEEPLQGFTTGEMVVRSDNVVPNSKEMEGSDDVLPQDQTMEEVVEGNDVASQDPTTEEVIEAVDSSSSQDYVDQKSLQTTSNVELKLQTNNIVVMTQLYDQSNANIIRRLGSGDVFPTAMAVAAGSESCLHRSGIWITPFISKGNKKRYKGYSGYKSNSTAITIGYDIMVSDNDIIGAAVTYGSSYIGYKDEKERDKTKLNTWLMSLYYSHQFQNNNFINTIIGVGSSRVNDSVNCVVNQNKVNTIAKYNTLHQNIEIIGGHNIKYDNGILLTPMLGVKSIRVSPRTYVRYIDNNHGIYIKNKLASRSEAVIGIGAAKSINYNDNVSIVPSIHTFINYAFNNKVANAVVVSGNYQSLNIQAPELHKLSYNIGTSLLAKSKNIEYGVIYETALAKKYQNHAAALKIKIRF